MELTQYNKLIKKVNNFYKSTNNKSANNIYNVSKTRATQLKFAKIIEQLINLETFIKLKGHNDNFLNTPTCGLLNPTKTNI